MNKKGFKRLVAKVLPTSIKVSIVKMRATSSAAISRLQKSLWLLQRHNTALPNIEVAGSVLAPRSALIAEHVDLWAEKARALEVVTDVLDSAGVEFALLPKTDGTKTVILSDSVMGPVLRLLAANMPADESWLLAPFRDDAVKMSRSAYVQDLDSKSTSRIRKYKDFALFSYQVSRGGREFGSAKSGVELSFWRQLRDDSSPRPDGYNYEKGTLIAPSQNGVCSYLSPGSWHDALSSPSRWPEGADRPHIYQITDPIDVVYTWVDGEDPDWQRSKNEALGLANASELNDTATNTSRYTSRNELMYSLRSIELYANWVRNIYIVTDHQVPAWLDTSNPRIKVINHEDIFHDTSVLPVFNSHAIESQLHHIDGLSNQFLYLNDDVFFGDLVRPEDFFQSSRITKYFPSKACLDVAPASARDLPVLSSAKNARRLIADEFGVNITNKFQHTPVPLQRDVLYEMEQRFPDLFNRVAASKFRHPSDYSIASGLYHYYAYCIGRALPGCIEYGYQDISRANLPIFLSRLVRGNPYRVFCLNDTATTPDQLAELLVEITDAMNKCYPFKSSFEN